MSTKDSMSKKLVDSMRKTKGGANKPKTDAESKPAAQKENVTKAAKAPKVAAKSKSPSKTTASSAGSYQSRCRVWPD